MDGGLDRTVKAKRGCEKPRHTRTASDVANVPCKARLNNRTNLKLRSSYGSTSVDVDDWASVVAVVVLLYTRVRIDGSGG